jgi:hypothetical protein
LYRFTSWKSENYQPGEIKVKPKADSALEASVKTSSDSPFSFVLHDGPFQSKLGWSIQYNQTATSHC